MFLCELGHPPHSLRFLDLPCVFHVHLLAGGPGEDKVLARIARLQTAASAEDGNSGLAFGTAPDPGDGLSSGGKDGGVGHNGVCLNFTLSASC